MLALLTIINLAITKCESEKELKIEQPNAPREPVLLTPEPEPAPPPAPNKRRREFETA